MCRGYNLINHNSDNDRHSLKRLSFESLSRGWLTKTQMKKRIKDAIDNGDWVILGSHFNSISDSETPDETSYNIANVLEILEYAHSLCPIRHTSDVWNQRKPMWLLLGK